MDRSSDSHTRFPGTYFDRDTSLRLARFAGMVAWVLLFVYIYNTVVALGQFLTMLASGGFSYAGISLFDRLSVPSAQISQLVPGLVYFVTLKTAQHVLLILLDVEDNSRRAARK